MVLRKRLTNLGSLIHKRPAASHDEDPSSELDTPEANAARGVRLFCESGAANTGEEVLHLPTIVEASVASPGAAAAACAQIRKFLSKENYSKPHVQYNAVMLIRILADNPGPSFTKNMDKSFADTVKHLLRNGNDPSVAQILRETLDSLHRDKAYDTNLTALFAMWKKEQGLMATAARQFGPRTMNAPPWTSAQQPGAYGAGAGKSERGLPPPIELAGRIEEARTSAKLLLQLVQSTPPNELLGNDLVKEFSERCMSAQRSIQGYINCDNPAPDDDTMLTLIETNEQLSLAASKHQRAVLQARRLIGPTPSPPAGPGLGPSPAGSISAPSGQYTAPSGAYSAPSQPPSGSYSAPPQPALASAEASHQPSYNFSSREQPSSAPQNENQKYDLPLPPALRAGPDRRPTEDDDPFADHHSPNYGAPATAPPPVPLQSTNGPEPTRSYLGRQESAANNLTMHGAGSQRELTEEEEYARQYPANQTRQSNDVSPIAERGTVTYRY